MEKEFKMSRSFMTSFKRLYILLERGKDFFHPFYCNKSIITLSDSCSCSGKKFKLTLDCVVLVGYTESDTKKMWIQTKKLKYFANFFGSPNRIR